ncbi:MAG TPA: hypothetical protein DD666_18440 [Advenella kashmirensis]|uniref:Uncharacterized protein n=1 Tax=Advenella kashmirensis TaxID=310575 RepID=A0A356LK16_9BURK|nr:hypothetical protein [Advenella kashmirensis]
MAQFQEGKLACYIFDTDWGSTVELSIVIQFGIFVTQFGTVVVEVFIESDFGNFKTRAIIIRLFTCLFKSIAYEKMANRL